MSSNEDFVGPLDQFLSQIGKGSNLIYGNPFENENVTVIPVSKITCGFGYGLGKKTSNKGMGCGAGVRVTPIGFIEISEGKSLFKPIRSLSLNKIILLTIAISGLLTLRFFHKS